MPYAKLLLVAFVVLTVLFIVSRFVTQEMRRILLVSGNALFVLSLVVFVLKVVAVDIFWKAMRGV